MQVVPVLHREYSKLKYEVSYWNLSNLDDIKWIFDTYISKSKRLGTWGANGTLNEIFLVII